METSFDVLKDKYPNATLNFSVDKFDTFLHHLKKMIREEFDLPYEPLMILAIGRGSDNIQLTNISADESHTYYRRDGVHYVPKLRTEELIIK